MIIETRDTKAVYSFISKLHIAPPDSHKGQNGKVLILGGSELFHASPLWSAEIASHFADMVHFSSTHENNEIFVQIKSQFRNGIVVPKKDMLSYIQEDHAVLIGPGMVRSQITNDELRITKYQDLLQITNEAEYASKLTQYLLKTYPQKRFVIDAGALQMMKPEWLAGRKESVIVTPHQLEFERLFGRSVDQLGVEEKEQAVQEMARTYQCVILLKAVDDIISDGDQIIRVIGGNQGLTKGGTGDVLAGLVLALYAKNNPVISTVVASVLEKTAADRLFETKGHWYNVADLINTIPEVLKDLVYNKDRGQS